MKEFVKDFSLRLHVFMLALEYLFISSLFYILVINVFDLNQQNMLLIVANLLYLLITLLLFVYMKSRKVVRVWKASLMNFTKFYLFSLFIGGVPA